MLILGRTPPTHRTRPRCSHPLLAPSPATAPLIGAGLQGSLLPTHTYTHTHTLIPARGEREREGEGAHPATSLLLTRYPMAGDSARRNLFFIHGGAPSSCRPCKRGAHLTPNTPAARLVSLAAPLPLAITSAAYKNEASLPVIEPATAGAATLLTRPPSLTGACFLSVGSSGLLACLPFFPPTPAGFEVSKKHHSFFYVRQTPVGTVVPPRLASNAFICSCVTEMCTAFDVVKGGFQQLNVLCQAYLVFYILLSGPCPEQVFVFRKA